MNITKAWEDTLLQLSVNAPLVHTLMRGVQPVSFEGNTLTVHTSYPQEVAGIERESKTILLAASYFFTGVKSLRVTTTEPEAGEPASMKQTQVSTPEQAWQAVLDTLREEMPQASFDTWVRDTELLSLDGSRAVIGARNAYARDWLESRMSNAISGNLAAILGHQVTVEFVVADDQPGEEEPGQEAGEASEKGMTLEPLDMTRYDLEVQPDRVVMLPGYSLRLLEQGDLTPKQMSLWVGFRQALYTRWKSGMGAVKNIPYWEAARFAMMSKASYFREIEAKNRIEENGREYVAGGMVEIVPEPDIKPGKGDARYDNANRYRVQMSPRLTRHDCAVIEDILNAKASMAATKPEANELVLAGLNEIATRDPGEYLNDPAELKDGWPRSILEIVRRVLGIEGDVPQDLADAAERATDRILSAFGKVFITHYFLRVVAPTLRLTHPQAWAIIMLRDRRWYDYKSQTQYDFAVVMGGLPKLAEWVGVSTESVGDWLKKPEFSAFVHMADASKLDIPDTWRENRAAVFLVHPLEPVFEDAPEKCDTVSGKVRHANRKSETRQPEKCDTPTGKMRHDLRKSETRLNRLINPLLTSINLNKPLKDSTTGGQTQGAEDVPSAWVLDRILSLNKTHPKTQKAVRGGDPNALISWMLYGASFAENPYNYALSRLALDPETGASEEFDRLAAMPPREFVDEIQSAISGNASAQWVGVLPRREAGIRILHALLGKNAPISLTREKTLEYSLDTPEGTRRMVKKVIEEY